MSSAEQHFSRGDTTLAVRMYTEVINLFPEILEALERRAQCYLTVVKKKCFFCACLDTVAQSPKIIIEQEGFIATGFK